MAFRCSFVQCVQGHFFGWHTGDMRHISSFLMCHWWSDKINDCRRKRYSAKWPVEMTKNTIPHTKEDTPSHLTICFISQTSISSRYSESQLIQHTDQQLSTLLLQAVLFCVTMEPTPSALSQSLMLWTAEKALWLNFPLPQWLWICGLEVDGGLREDFQQLSQIGVFIVWEYLHDE